MALQNAKQKNHNVSLAYHVQCSRDMFNTSKNKNKKKSIQFSITIVGARRQAHSFPQLHHAFAHSMHHCKFVDETKSFRCPKQEKCTGHDLLQLGGGLKIYSIMLGCTDALWERAKTEQKLSSSNDPMQATLGTSKSLCPQNYLKRFSYNDTPMNKKKKDISGAVSSLGPHRDWWQDVWRN